MLSLCQGATPTVARLAREPTGLGAKQWPGGGYPEKGPSVLLAQSRISEPAVPESPSWVGPPHVPTIGVQ